MKRRKFLHIVGITTLALLSPITNNAQTIFYNSKLTAEKYLKKIVTIINSLKLSGSNLVLKIMDGGEYEFDPNIHYPFDGGIVDPDTNSRVFFHAHRENEYGHFHTFVEDENGELIHLLLISMNKQGEPIGLSTVNRWVTGDKYVKADELKKHFEKFSIDKKIFKDERVLDFIENIFLGYKKQIFKLFDERDEWISSYVNKHYNEPFEDRDYEILSSLEINILKS
ncbi:MAG: hypothetical protein V3V16_10940 [Melioribacteraceae bacterium]